MSGSQTFLYNRTQSKFHNSKPAIDKLIERGHSQKEDSLKV